MVNRYLKLSAEESTLIKNQLDISKNKLINIIKIIRNYRISRKKEIILKNKLKINVSQLKAKITALEITFPEDERKEYEKTHHLTNYPIIAKEEIDKDHTENEDKTLNSFEDLEDIKSQLSRFEK